jgi:quinol monooxygenase YgiN
MEIYIFAKFHALEGKQREATEALEEVLGPTRNEPGCIRIHAFRSIRDGHLFYIHSTWKDEEAFENHAQLPHTVRFRKRMETLIAHAFEVNRTERIG